MFKFISTYKHVERNIVYLMLAELFLQLINSSFTLILNIYMTHSGYADPEIATFVSYRFMAALVFALPFGLFIRTKAIRPILLFSSAILPIVSLLILEAIVWKSNILLQFSMIIWGLCFAANQIAVLPFILRNSSSETHTESISLNASVWSIATIASGFLIYLLTRIDAQLFNEKILLQIFSLLGVISFWFTWKISAVEKIPVLPVSETGRRFDYDWKVIGKAVVPTFMIAVGAGLSIPFMNLFFFHVFGLSSGNYSLLGSITGVAVAFFSLQAPLVKKRFGYEAITATQMLSIVALILLGSTEFLGAGAFSFYLAAFCFIIRQPLMNLANPMTSQMTMYYVGKKNQELVSAIISSIWSGSWFFSAIMFRYLREMNLQYGYIIYITAAFYLVAVLFYHLLIKDFRRKEQLGLE